MGILHWWLSTGTKMDKGSERESYKQQITDLSRTWHASWRMSFHSTDRVNCWHFFNHDYCLKPHIDHFRVSFIFGSY
jgi:hypothetical protein